MNQPETIETKIKDLYTAIALIPIFLFLTFFAVPLLSLMGINFEIVGVITIESVGLLLGAASIWILRRVLKKFNTTPNG